MTTINPDYEKILDDLLNQSGGKEYCLRQIISESDYRKFSDEYRTNNKSIILEKIQKLYGETPIIPTNLIDIEITPTQWNKHLMKLYFYDTVNHRFFEYSIKTIQAENVSMFEDDNGTYQKSFFNKVKGGYALWEQYNQPLIERQREQEIEKRAELLLLFKEKIKKMKLTSSDDFDAIASIKAPDQYTDGRVRYISNNQYYYHIADLNGYVTFEEGNDLLADDAFSKLFNEKVLKQNSTCCVRTCQY